MQKKYLKLNDIASYKRALKLSNYVWGVVNKWDWFAKRVVGTQYVTAVDSISSTIAEGFGRYFKKDKILFYRYSNGSVFESKDWTQKSKTRKLLKNNEYKHISQELEKSPREIYHLINYTNKKLEK